jgi:hypothetical protein
MGVGSCVCEEGWGAVCVRCQQTSQPAQRASQPTSPACPASQPPSPASQSMNRQHMSFTLATIMNNKMRVCVSSVFAPHTLHFH